MTTVHHVFVGAAKSAEGGRGGVFRQALGSQRWDRLDEGLPGDAEVHAVTVDPNATDTVMIATTKGAFRSKNRGDKWERLALPDQGTDIWSITVHPTDPRTIYAGYGPTGVYRSDDGGDHWKKLPDPKLPDRYACIEANGAMKSRDRGESWEDCTTDLLRFAEQEKYKSRIVSQTEIEGMLDGHALACSAAAPGTVFLANRMGLFRSDDRGAHWQDVEIGRFSPMSYGRDLRVSRHDPKVLYAALSPAFRSADGAIYKSEDLQERGCRQDLEAPGPRGQGRGDDDGRLDQSARPVAGLRAHQVRPGLRHAGWRPELGRAAAARRGRRLLRDRRRLTRI
jgi:hypothetical protein